MNVSVRDLRSDGGRVLDRVERGETVIITRNGRPVAELRDFAAIEGLDLHGVRHPDATS